MERNTIFISYAREDSASRDELLKHLEVILGQPPTIPIFADSSIDVGEEWHDRIISEMDQALVVVLLVSADLLTSKFVKTIEIPRAALAAKRGDATIACLYVWPCPATSFRIDVDDPEGEKFAIRVTDYQGINDPSHPVMSLREGAERRQLLADAASEIVQLAEAQLLEFAERKARAEAERAAAERRAKEEEAEAERKAKAKRKQETEEARAAAAEAERQQEARAATEPVVEQQATPPVRDSPAPQVVKVAKPAPTRLADQPEPKRPTWLMPASLAGVAAVGIAAWQLWPSAASERRIEDSAVAAVEPLIEDFQASPTSITQGDEVTLTWRTLLADSVRLDPLNTVHLPNGSVADTPDEDTEYVLMAYGPGGRALDSIQVRVAAIIADAPAIGAFNGDVVAYGSDPQYPGQELVVMRSGAIVSRRSGGGDESVLSDSIRGGIAEERFGNVLPLARRPGQLDIIYFASQRIWRFQEGGQTSPYEISPDLTRFDPMVVNQAYISAIAVAADGTIWSGSADGLVHVSRDEGRNWTNVTPPTTSDFWRVDDILFPDGEVGAIACVVASDPTPERSAWTWRTEDFGASWTRLADHAVCVIGG